MVKINIIVKKQKNVITKKNDITVKNDKKDITPQNNFNFFNNYIKKESKCFFSSQSFCNN